MASVLSKLRKHLGFSGKTRPSSLPGKTRPSYLPGELCRHFSLDEIRTATHDFNEELIVGVGVFGTAYKGFIDGGNSRPVAIRRLKNSLMDEVGEEMYRTETLLLCQIRHVHLIPFLGYCIDKGEMILVYDFMANNNLRGHLYGTDKAPLLWKQRLQICIGAGRGLHYLHTGLKHPVVHRDVKTANILLDEKWVAKVSSFGVSKQVLNDIIKSSNLVVDVDGTWGPLDFGLSEQISSNTTAGYNNLSGNVSETGSVRGTFGYLDPEYYRGGRLTTKSDVYSFGVVLLEVLCARPPADLILDEAEHFNFADWAKNCIMNGSIGEIIDPYLKAGKIAPECFKVYVEIAVACVQLKGIQRPTMLEVMEKLELALELQEKADSEREKMISPGRSMPDLSLIRTYSDIVEDLSTNSQTPPN